MTNPRSIDKRRVELTNQALEHWHDYNKTGDVEAKRKTEEILYQIDELKRNPLQKLFRFVTGL